MSKRSAFIDVSFVFTILGDQIIFFMPLSMNLYLKEVQISTLVSSVAKNDSKILFGPTSGISKKETHRGGIHG